MGFLCKKNCAPSWRYLQDYTGMHGQQNIQFGNTKQVKQILRKFVQKS
jgi:hypothetical protein